MGHHEPNPPSLAEIQRWFQWIIVDPRGPGPALQRAPRGELRFRPIDREQVRSRYLEPGTRLKEWVNDGPGSFRLRGLEIYAESHFLRHTEVLAETYPKTRMCLGNGKFLALAADYLKQYPPASPSINDFGENLPSFIKRHLFSKIFPHLAEMVLLEWTLMVSCSEGDGPRVGSRRLSLHPSVRILRFRHPILEHWVRPRRRKLKPFARPRALLIGNGEMTWIEHDECQILQRIGAGDTLARLAQRFSSRVSGTRISDLFRKWVALGWITLREPASLSRLPRI